jgi:hypothetical protein
MKRHIFPVILASAFLFCLTLVPARANDGPTVSILGSLESIEESAISLDKELVEFTVPKDLGRSIPAKATFWFSNPTEKDIETGSIFPLTFEGPGAYSFGTTTYAENVTAKVNGVLAKGEVKFEEYPYRDASNPDELVPKEAEGYVFSFTVPAKKTIKVEVEFDAPLSQVAYPTFDYYIGSGAGWAGPIKEAKFVVHYPYALSEGWVSANSWYDAGFGYRGEYWGKVSISGKDFTLVSKPIEPDSGRSAIGFRIFPPAHAMRLIELEKKAPGFTQAGEWFSLAQLYRSFEYEDGQFDNYRPQFAVDGYWLAIDKYLEGLGIDSFKPKGYLEAAMLAEIYTDHWAPMNINGNPNEPQFYDIERFAKLMGYLENQKSNWWGFGLTRLNAILDKGSEWLEKAQEHKTGFPWQPAPASSAAAGKMTDSAVSSDELDKLNRETQALRNELAGVRRAHLSAVKSGNGIDPVVALLFVFGGVAAGFLTVALVKRALAKKK